MAISAVLLCLCLFGVKAQVYPGILLDGPSFTVDSLSLSAFSSAMPATLPILAYPRFPLIRNSSFPAMPLFETQEQRAARINRQTFDAVMFSVDRNLYWQRQQKIPKLWMPAIFVARLFLSNPFGFPEGCVPLMNASFPFIYAKTPGMAPYYNPYTSDQFPKCIETEYDFATGTYRQVMVDWSEVQSRLSDSNFGFSSQPVPNIPVTPVERALH